MERDTKGGDSDRDQCPLSVTAYRGPGFSPVFLLADYEPIERPIILGRNSWEEMAFALPFLGRIYINSCLPTTSGAGSLVQATG